MPFCTVGNPLVAMVTDLCCHLDYDSRGAWHTMYAMLLSKYVLLMIEGEHGNVQCMPCSPQIISEMLSEIHTMEKCIFLKFMIYSQIIV